MVANLLCPESGGLVVGWRPPSEQHGAVASYRLYYRLAAEERYRTRRLEAGSTEARLDMARLANTTTG